MSDGMLIPLLKKNDELEIRIQRLEKHVQMLENGTKKTEKSWHDMNEECPESDGYYVVTASNNMPLIALWNVDKDGFEVNGLRMCPRYWMEIPELDL